MSNDVIKHSAVIQLASSLSLAQRQTYNALLKNAFPWLQRGEDHFVQVRHLEALLRKSGSRNRDWIAETAESLRDQPVRYNVLGKDREHREVWEMHSGLLAEVGRNSSGDLIKYSFPNTLVELIAQPRMYAKINLDLQARFRGHHGLPLYEFYLDILGGKRDHIEYTLWISDLRRLLCLENAYPEYRRLQEKVLKPAHAEINKQTDIRVTVDHVLREQRQVVGLHLHIERKHPGRQACEAGEGNGGAGPLERALRGYYTAEQVATILNKYEGAYIRAQLDYVQSQLDQGRVDRPAAYLRAALQTDYADHRAHKKVPSTPASKPASARDDRDKPTPYAQRSEAEQQKVWEHFRANWAAMLKGLAISYTDPDDYAEQERQVFDKYLQEHGLK